MTPGQVVRLIFAVLLVFFTLTTAGTWKEGGAQLYFSASMMTTVFIILVRNGELPS